MTSDKTQLLENAQYVSSILKQLANPYRLIILCSLANQELTVGDLNEQVELSQSALSQHLAKLRESEIVTTRRESQTIYYRIANPKIKHLLEVLQQQTVKEKGCIFFDVLQNKEDPTLFILWEEWINEDALKEHFNQAHTKAYLAKSLTEVRYIEKLVKLS